MTRPFFVLTTALAFLFITWNSCYAEESVLNLFPEYKQQIDQMNQRINELASKVSQKKQGCQNGIFLAAKGKGLVPGFMYPTSTYFRFSPAFDSTPSVLTGLARYQTTKIDVDDDLTIKVTELSRTGFRLTINRNAFYSILKFPADVNWMACPRNV